MVAEIETQDAAHVDVLVPDRREPSHYLVGMITGRGSIIAWIRCVFQAMTIFASKLRAPEIVPSSS